MNVPRPDKARAAHNISCFHGVSDTLRLPSSSKMTEKWHWDRWLDFLILMTCSFSFQKETPSQTLWIIFLATQRMSETDTNSVAVFYSYWPCHICPASNKRSRKSFPRKSRNQNVVSFIAWMKMKYVFQPEEQTNWWAVSISQKTLYQIKSHEILILLF